MATDAVIYLKPTGVAGVDPGIDNVLVTTGLGQVDRQRIALGSATDGSASGDVLVTIAAPPSNAPAMAVRNIPSGTQDVNLAGAAAVATAALSNVAGSASSVALLAANAARRGASFFNDGAAFLYLKLGATASLTSYTVRIPPFGLYELPQPVYSGAIDGIWSSAAGACRVTEL